MRRRLGAVVIAQLFGNEGSPLRPVELNVAADFTRLEVAEYFPDTHESESEIAGCSTSHDSAEFLSNERIALRRRTTAQSFSAMSESPS
eukprot:3873355-Pleurochrysis_carterae.AAC.1